MSNTYRFVMEEPSEAGRGQQKKRARLVTACDNCRNKKIKCLRTPASLHCESCKQSATECTFSDRDKYQAEKLGVPYTGGVPYPPPAASSAWRQEGVADGDGGVGPVRRRSASINGTGNGNGQNGFVNGHANGMNGMNGMNGQPSASTSTHPHPHLSQPIAPNGHRPHPSLDSVTTSTSRSSSQPSPLEPHTPYDAYSSMPSSAATPNSSFNNILRANRMYAPHPSHPNQTPNPNQNQQHMHQLAYPSSAPDHYQLQYPDGNANAQQGIGHKDKGELKRISVPFFRYFGATANTPGYRRINVRTHTYDTPPPPASRCSSPSASVPPADPSPSTPSLSTPHPSFPSPYPPDLLSHTFNPRHPFHRPPLPPARPSSPPAPAVLDDPRPLFDPADSVPTMPHPAHLPHLAELFFDSFGAHFPFLDRHEVLLSVQERRISATLANCIAALAIRFTDRSELLFPPPEQEGLPPRRARAGERYCMRAKEIVTPYLSLPSIEIVQALVLIAWAEFGCGRDSGLWMYSRMAVAMAMDLGLGFEATIQLASEKPERIRLTWWAVILVDRINCWGTGRPIAIPDDAFDTALPSVPPVPGGFNLSNPPPPGYVFGHLCRLVQLRGRMGDVINNSVKRRLSTSPVDMELTHLQYELMSFYGTLPSDLQFNLANFKVYFHANQGALFLLLHVMFHSVLIVLHRPQLLEDFTPNVARASMPSVELSRSSARTIVDIVHMADEQGPRALMANPFVDLPILTAARSFLEDRKELPADNLPSGLLMSRKWPDASVAKCKGFLAKMSKYWGGVMAVRRILEEQDKSPEGNFDLGRGESGDSQVAPMRPDGELIKLWATKQWRHHVNNNKKSQKDSDSNGPTSPTDSDLAGIHQMGDSPEGASIGITGTLDSLLGFDPGIGMRPTDPQSLLRVSFNPAEADFQFSNLPAQYYSLSDPVDSFLQTLQGGLSSTPMPDPNSLMTDVSMSDGHSSNGTGMFDNDAMLLFQNEIGRFFSIPEHLSRAPSPRTDGQ